MKQRGKRKIQLIDIARQAGLSASGVSLALRNDPRISTSTRQRVKSIARELGYSAAPRRSSANAMWRFGFVYCDPQATAFDPMTFAPVQRLLMRDAMRLSARFEMLLIDEDIEKSQPREMLLDFAGHVQGLIVFGHVHAPVLELLNRIGLPAVVVGECDVSTSKAESLKMQRVTEDPMRAALQATRYLLRRGRRRIAMVSGVRIPGFYYDQWYRGFLLGHAEADVTVDPARVMFQDVKDPLIGHLPRLLEPAIRPDAIVWPDMSIAEVSVPMLRSIGLDIPPEDQVIGGASHNPTPESLQGFPAVLTDLAALTREAILRLQFICKHGSHTSAVIVLPTVNRNLPADDESDE